jgi:tetratricopeptide (TPR) repeat protein
MMCHKILVSAALALGLGACVSQPPPPPSPIVDAQPAPAPLDASPYGLFLAGRAARDEGRFADAAAYLARAAEGEGGPAFLKADAFHASLESGDIVAAASLVPNGADAAPGDVALGALVDGVEALAEDKDKAAYATLSGPTQGYPFKVAALLLAPYAAAGAGDAADAVARPELGGDPVAQFIGDLDQTELYERTGRLKDAEAAYKSLLQTGGAGGLVAAAYGAFLERQHRAQEAISIYRTQLAADPDDIVLASALARAQKRGRPPALGDVRTSAAQALVVPAASLIARKQLELALIDLRLALRLDPNSDEAWVLVGDILGRGDAEAARAAYAHVPPASIRYPAARSKLAYSYQASGDDAAALQVARDTAAQAPGNRDAAVTLANLLRENGQYADSAAVLTKLIDATATPDWRLYYLRASSYDQAGDTEHTQTDLSEALKLDPDEPTLLNFQGYFWIDRGEHLQEALAMVRKAVDADPQSGAMIDSLGWAYYRLGDYKDAVANLETAVGIDASIPEVNDHLGDAYWRVGRKTEATFQWRRVLSLDPDAKLRASATAKLASPLGPDAPPLPAIETPPAKTP